MDFLDLCLEVGALSVGKGGAGDACALEGAGLDDIHAYAFHLKRLGVVRDGHVDTDRADSGRRGGDEAVGSGTDPVGGRRGLGIGESHSGLAGAGEGSGGLFDPSDSTARGGDIDEDGFDLGVVFHHLKGRRELVNVGGTSERLKAG